MNVLLTDRQRLRCDTTHGTTNECFFSIRAVEGHGTGHVVQQCFWIALFAHVQNVPCQATAVPDIPHQLGVRIASM